MIQLIDNLNYRGPGANFERDCFATLEDMCNYREKDLDEGHLSYCLETQLFYVFNSDNEYMVPVGKWRELWTTFGGLIDSLKITDYLSKDPLTFVDQALMDGEGNVIADTYVTKDAVKEYVQDVMLNSVMMLNILEGQITPSMLSEPLWDLISAGNNKHIAVADDEDLTDIKHTIKFKDKLYDPNDFSGLGRCYLRKNLVGGVNILKQDVFKSTNTIYIIQYDYDLDGEEITIPADCTLKFEGGTFYNGSVVFDNTTIEPNGCVITNYITADISGTYAIGQCLYSLEDGKPIWYNGDAWVDATGAEI